jgi:hypothetical protein
MTDFTPTTNLAANKAIIIDTEAPTITSVTSDKANGQYSTGIVIDIDVNFSEAVTTTGNVTVTLETGVTDRTCTFTVTNSTQGTCNYTVQAGDSSLDLTTSSIATSGTISDQAGNTQVNFTPATNLADNKAIVINTQAPTITNITSDKANGRYKQGETIDIDLTFSTAVTSTGDVTVTLETGATDRTCTFQVTNSTTASCNYIVQAADTSNDLTVSLIAGTIKDQLDNEMTSFIPTTNLAANKAIIIDTQAPTIVTFTPPDEGTALIANTPLYLKFSEPVIKGTGNIEIRLSSDNSLQETIDITSALVTGWSSTTLTVDPSIPFVSLESYYINIDSGAITDLALNNYAGISNATTWNFTSGDFTLPVILSVTSTKPNGTYDADTVIPITVNFSENVTSTGVVTITLEIAHS